MKFAGDGTGYIPPDINDVLIGLGPAQLDKHRENVDGVDQGVHEVGEDDEDDVHVLDLFPFEMQESLRQGMFEESSVRTLHQFYEYGDILSLLGVSAVNVGRQFVEVQLDSGVRVQLRGSLQLQAGVKSLLEGFKALRDMFVDEEKS